MRESARAALLISTLAGALLLAASAGAPPWRSDVAALQVARRARGAYAGGAGGPAGVGRRGAPVPARVARPPGGKHRRAGWTEAARRAPPRPAMGGAPRRRGRRPEQRLGAPSAETSLAGTARLADRRSGRR